MIRWGKWAAASLAAVSMSMAVPTWPADAAAAAEPITVLLDDVAMTFDGAVPEIRNDYTFVPFRPLADALGIGIEWDAKARAVTATAQSGSTTKVVVLTVGSDYADVDGSKVKLGAAPYISHDRTLIPLSFFSTQFGATGGWDKETRTVTIVSLAREMHLRGFYAISSFAERDRISGLNSVAFGWARVDANGELTTTGKDFYWPQAAGEITPESIVRDAAAQGTDPYLMVYAADGNGELTRMLSDDTLRSRSIDSIVRLAQEKGFAGIMLDYEGLGLRLDPIGQRKLLNDYVRQLANELKLLGIRLTIAVPPPNSSYKGYDYPTLAGMVEDLTVMAYEYHPQGTPDHTPQPNDKVHEAIRELLAAGVPREKLLLGVDLWSETPQSIDDKLGLAKRYGLKGAAIWRIGLYSYDGQEMAEAIQRSVVKQSGVQ